MSASGLRVAMFAPGREQCGISDYTRHLVEGLRALPEIAEVRMVEAPAGVAYEGTLNALRRYAADEGRFRALGAAMNLDADIAHVQHQYFFFGGVAPHKNHARAFLDAARVPLVMTVHEIAQSAPSASPLTRRALDYVNRVNLLHPAIRRWLVHTEMDRERLVTLGAEAARIRVIPVGVPPAEPMPDVESAKREMGLEGRRVVTLFGFLSAKKGHRLALDALPALPEDALLLFAGDRHPDDHTDYVPNLRAEIARRGLEARVRITGYLPEERLTVVMAATEVAIAPFSQTSGSASLAHLFAYGRPVVASDIPPHREIAREAPACLSLFRSGDASDFAARLLTILNDSALRASLQSAARAYASRHAYPVMARETAAIYRLAVSELRVGSPQV